MKVTTEAPAPDSKLSDGPTVNDLLPHGNGWAFKSDGEYFL